ncbi:MAG: nitrogen regulation protein NR(II) [Vicinamibacterales bacterium]
MGGFGMTQYGFLLLGLTAIVAMVVGFLTFALLRLGAGVRDANRQLKSGTGAETALLSAALQEAVGTLKAQEQAMSARAAASEALSAQIVSRLTAGLLVTDGDGRIRILNPAGERLLGVAGDTVGRPMEDVLAQAPPLAAAISECLVTGEAIVRRSLPMPPASKATHLGVTASPLGAPGERSGVICLFSDLTAVYDLEEQLRLKETLARLGELTAGIAHEFRNGLATIHGYSRLIDPRELPERYAPYVAGIRQETEALGELVTNFLNFARPQQLALAPIDLGSVIHRAADDLRHEAGDAVITVEGQFARVNGDEVLLRQVFSNLLRNAVEAAAGGGVRPAVRVHAIVDRERERCTVFVDDNGPGVPEDARDKVFRPFFTTRSRGTGLGLAIVQKIVLSHDGRISVDASPEGGARFQLIIKTT